MASGPTDGLYGRSIFRQAGVPSSGVLVKLLRLGRCSQPRSVRNQMGRVPAPLPGEAAARDAQQSDRGGRAPRPQEQSRLDCHFQPFAAQLRTLTLAGMDARTLDGAFCFAKLLRLRRCPQPRSDPCRLCSSSDPR